MWTGQSRGRDSRSKTQRSRKQSPGTAPLRRTVPKRDATAPRSAEAAAPPGRICRFLSPHPPAARTPARAQPENPSPFFPIPCLLSSRRSIPSKFLYRQYMRSAALRAFSLIRGAGPLRPHKQKSGVPFGTPLFSFSWKGSPPLSPRDSPLRRAGSWAGCRRCR